MTEVEMWHYTRDICIQKNQVLANIEEKKNKR